MSCNQASFCLYTLRTISDRAEETFERLRYFLGGDRPSQTAHLTVFQDLIQGLWLGSHRVSSDPHERRNDLGTVSTIDSVKL